jgi:cytochrome c oxidase subunit 3
MAREATARALVESGPQLRPIPGFGGGPPRGATTPAVSNAHLAVLVLLAAETMLFIGLLGAYVLFRNASPLWPPAGLPRLPLLITWLNTAVLIGSGITMHAARRARRDGRQTPLLRRLLVTAVLGVAFLAVQGFEWIRLIQHGLTLSSGVYGATFYTLIGLHGVHVVAAVVWLLAVAGGAWGRRAWAAGPAVVDVCGIYWDFVVGLWVVLFAMVYLQ